MCQRCASVKLLIGSRDLSPYLRHCTHTHARAHTCTRTHAHAQTHARTHTRTRPSLCRSSAGYVQICCTEFQANRTLSFEKYTASHCSVTDSIKSTHSHTHTPTQLTPDRCLAPSLHKHYVSYTRFTSFFSSNVCDVASRPTLAYSIVHRQSAGTPRS